MRLVVDVLSWKGEDHRKCKFKSWHVALTLFYFVWLIKMHRTKDLLHEDS